MKVSCLDEIVLPFLNARIAFSQQGKAGYAVTKEGKTKVLTVTFL